MTPLKDCRRQQVVAELRGTGDRQDAQAGVIFLYTSGNNSAYKRKVLVLGMMGSKYTVQTSNRALVYTVTTL